MSERRSAGRVWLESVSEDGFCRANFEGSPSIAMIDLLAALTGEKPTTLPPLFDTVDPAALDALLDRSWPAAEEGAVHVDVRWAGHRFSVRSDGTIEVAPSTEAEPAADG